MQPRVRADRVVTRSTRDLVLTALRARGPMSRADLARYANAAPSTISGVVQELLLAGLVVPSPHQAGTHTSDTALAAAARLVGEALAAAGLGRDALIRAGVSVPSPVSRHPDAVTPSAILPGWHGVAADEIADALGVAVSIDNDSNLAALGEHVWGAGRGCLETYAAISAIMEALRPQHGNLTLAQLMRLLAVRDPGAVRVVGDAAELIGMHLATVCNLLAPQRVIIVGSMAQAGELVLDPIRTAVKRRIAPNAVPEIVLGSLGSRNTALGAIALALDETDWLPLRRPVRLPRKS